MQAGAQSALFSSVTPHLKPYLTAGSYTINIHYLTEWIYVWSPFEIPKDSGFSHSPLTLFSESSSHFLGRILSGRKKQKSSQLPATSGSASKRDLQYFIASASFPNNNLDFPLLTGFSMLLSGLRNQPASAEPLHQTVNRPPHVVIPHPSSGQKISSPHVKVTEAPRCNFTSGFLLPTTESEEAGH